MQTTLFTISFLSLLTGLIGFIFHAFGRDKKYFTVATLATLVSFISLIALSTNQVIAHSLSHQIFNILACLMLGIYFWAEFRYRLRLLGAIFVPIVTLLMLIPLLSGTNAPVSTAALKSPFIIQLHIILLLLGLALFFLAFALGVIYLIKMRALKSHNSLAFDGRLPSLSKLQSNFLGTFNMGWICITVGIVLVGLFAFISKTDIQSNAKIIWGTVIWVIYTLLFLLNQTGKLNTRNLARCMTFFFFVVMAFWLSYSLSTSPAPSKPAVQVKSGI